MSGSSDLSSSGVVHGERVGSFHVGVELGSGGFASVYRLDRKDGGELSAPLAAKVLHAAADMRPDLVERLCEEARVLRNLQHPNIVALREVVSLDGRIALLMEYVPGVDLKHVIENSGPLPPGHAVWICEQVASALAFALEHVPDETGRPLRLVHRDIKPANIMLTGAGAVKLLDYGLSKADLAGGRVDSGMMVAGTPPFCPPERLLGEPAAGSSDSWSLGMTLLCMLVGRLPPEPPVREASYEMWLTATLALFDRKNLPSAAVRLVSDALSWDPRERPDAKAWASRAHELWMALGGSAFRDWAHGVVGALAKKARTSASAGDLTGLIVDARAVSGVMSRARVKDSGPGLATAGAEAQRPVRARGGGASLVQRDDRRTGWMVFGLGVLAALLLVVGVEWWVSGLPQKTAVTAQMPSGASAAPDVANVVPAGKDPTPGGPVPPAVPPRASGAGRAPASEAASAASVVPPDPGAGSAPGVAGVVSEVPEDLPEEPKCPVEVKVRPGRYTLRYQASEGGPRLASEFVVQGDRTYTVTCNSKGCTARDARTEHTNGLSWVIIRGSVADGSLTGPTPFVCVHGG